jgi:hypothetical protein
MGMTFRWIARTTLLTVACQLAGCVCGAVLCLGGLSVQIPIAGGIAPWDTYCVEITAGETRAVCTFTPPNGCANLSCSAGVSPEFPCDNDGGLSSFDHLVVALRNATPRDVSVRVLRNGAELSSWSFAPTYTTSDINGPGCGDCTGARVVLRLP